MKTVSDALVKQDSSVKILGAYEERWRSSWVKDELWKVRNFHQGFENGFWAGAAHGGIQWLTGGR